LFSLQDYLLNVELDTETGCTLFKYFNFLRQKSSGDLMTNAKFMRHFVLNHPAYKQDSIVSEEINFDLFCEIDKIVSGKIPLTEALKKK
jgi:glutamate--cysteine ligase catalytic subunit